MVPVALALVAMVTADAQTTTGERKGEGKSAQRFITTRPADFDNDDDNNVIFENNRNRNNNRNFGFRGGSAFVTPNPTRVITVSTAPGLNVSPGFRPDPIVFGGDDRFNNIYSPGFISGINNGLGGNVLGGGLLGGGVLGGNVFGRPGAGFPVNEGYSRYLELLVARDPTILLQNPELLLQYPQLILIRPELAFQYPQLRQYIDPRLLNLAGSPFDLNNQQGPFRRVFPPTFLGNAGNFDDGSRFNGINNIGGFNQGIDFQRPIDIRGGINRPILTTVAPPLNFGTINPNRNIRFSKK